MRISLSQYVVRKKKQGIIFNEVSYFHYLNHNFIIQCFSFMLKPLSQILLLASHNNKWLGGETEKGDEKMKGQTGILMSPIFQSPVQTEPKSQLNSQSVQSIKPSSPNLKGQKKKIHRILFNFLNFLFNHT